MWHTPHQRTTIVARVPFVAVGWKKISVPSFNGTDRCGTMSAEEPSAKTVLQEVFPRFFSPQIDGFAGCWLSSPRTFSSSSWSPERCRGCNVNPGLSSAHCPPAGVRN